MERKALSTRRSESSIFRYIETLIRYPTLTAVYIRRIASPSPAAAPVRHVVDAAVMVTCIPAHFPAPKRDDSTHSGRNYKLYF